LNLRRHLRKEERGEEKGGGKGEGGETAHNPLATLRPALRGESGSVISAFARRKRGREEGSKVVVLPQPYGLSRK